MGIFSTEGTESTEKSLVRGMCKPGKALIGISMKTFAYPSWAPPAIQYGIDHRVIALNTVINCEWEAFGEHTMISPEMLIVHSGIQLEGIDIGE